MGETGRACDAFLAGTHTGYLWMNAASAATPKFSSTRLTTTRLTAEYRGLSGLKVAFRNCRWTRSRATLEWGKNRPRKHGRLRRGDASSGLIDLGSLVGEVWQILCWCDQMFHWPGAAPLVSYQLIPHMPSGRSSYPWFVPPLGVWRVGVLQLRSWGLEHQLPSTRVVPTSMDVPNGQD